MKKQFYLITGLDEGNPITPYIINNIDNDLDFHLMENGDMVRYYEEIDTTKIDLTDYGYSYDLEFNDLSDDEKKELLKEIYTPTPENLQIKEYTILVEVKFLRCVKVKGRYCLYMVKSQCYQTIKGYRKKDYIKQCERLNKLDEVMK